MVKVVQALGANTYAAPRALTEEAVKRGQAAKSTLALLSCVGMGLRQFLGSAKVFAMTKANFGWVARPPTLQLSKQLFSDVFRHAHKVRYSSPWVRALVFGANVHLDCTWATTLVGALAKHSNFRLCIGPCCVGRLRLPCMVGCLSVVGDCFCLGCGSMTCPVLPSIFVRLLLLFRRTGRGVFSIKRVSVGELGVRFVGLTVVVMRCVISG